MILQMVELKETYIENGLMQVSVVQSETSNYAGFPCKN